MPIKVACETGHKFNAPDHYLGRTVRCPVCSVAVVIAPAGTVPQAASPPATRPPPLPATQSKKADSSPAAPPPRPSLPVHPPKAERPALPPQPAPKVAAEPPRSTPLESVVRTEAPPPERPDRVAPPSSPQSQAEVPVAHWHQAQPGEERDEISPSAESVAQVSPGLPVHGYEPDADRYWHSIYFACALAAVAILGMFPGLREFTRHLTAEESSGIGRWAFVVVLIGVVQLAYALFLIQAPDWSTTMVVAVVCLLITVAYAAVLSVTLAGQRDSHIISLLQLGDLLAAREAARWCLVMLGATSIATYFIGHFGMTWLRKYDALTSATPASSEA